MQVPVLKEVLDAMAIPRYEMAGWEADDLLGTISRKCEAAGWDCVVVTGDKDSLQLITDHTKVKLVSTRMGQTTTKDMTPAAFQEQYGFEPIHMIDLKALMGDSSDNIPGVKGVGEKTAMGLVQMYGSIDHLYDHLPDIVTAPETPAKPAMVKKLTEGRAEADHSRFLATIVTDAPLDFHPEDNVRQAFRPELYDLFLKLEFSKLIDKYGLKPGAQTPAPQADIHVDFETVTDQARADELLAQWQGADHVAVLALPYLSAVAVYQELCDGQATMSEVFFHRFTGDWNGLLRTLFSNQVKKISHDVKDLMRLLLENGLPAEGFVFDTALAAYLLDATAGGYDLSRLFLSYCGAELPKPAHLAEGAFSLLGDATGAEASFASYTTAVAALYPLLLSQLKENNLLELFETVELPLCPVLAEMELTGFRVDAGELRRFGETMDGRMKTLEAAIYELAGGAFNINSPKQLGEVLFERLGLPPAKKTKTGYSTNADVLEKLRTQHPIVDAVLEYRQYAKLKSTYADGLLKVLAPDGRIHTSFQMTVTATGRLSSTEPNLQNIPTRTDLGSEIRKMFIPGEGCVLVDADYSQIELRLLAHIADDKAMQEAFRTGVDIHTVTASQAFGVPIEQVTHQMRSSAKAVNFGIVYGISPFSLAQDIGVAQWEAKEYIESYFKTYPGVRRYMDAVVEQARADGYVDTLWHRRRALPELKSSNFNMRSFGERVALNMPIQGTAADIMKLAMIAVWKRLKEENLQARLVLQVHDELIVECPPQESAAVERLLTEEMAGVAHLAVPLAAEAHTGNNWLAAKG